MVRPSSQGGGNSEEIHEVTRGSFGREIVRAPPHSNPPPPPSSFEFEFETAVKSEGSVGDGPTPHHQQGGFGLQEDGVRFSYPSHRVRIVVNETRTSSIGFHLQHSQGSGARTEPHAGPARFVSLIPFPHALLHPTPSRGGSPSVAVEIDA